MRTAHKIAVLALIAVCATTADQGIAAANDGNGWKTIKFFGTDTGGSLEYTNPNCDTAGNCVYVLHATGGQLGGDLNGSEIGTGLATISTTGVAVIQQTAVFTGSIRGCGSGTVNYTNHGVAQPNEIIFRWTLTIEPGTGTGDFEGMTGTAFGRVDTTDPNAVATASGTFRCRRQP